MANPIGARKNSNFKAVSTAPSFNKTPVGSSTPPLPYPVTQDLGNSMGTVPSVCFNGDPAYVLDQTTQPSCKGDDPGTATGVKSGTVNGEVKPVQGSSSVRVGGHWLIRQGDPCTMNGGNCPGIYITTQVSSAMTGVGSTSESTNPLVEPETEEEKGFIDSIKDTIKGLAQSYKENGSKQLHNFAGDAMDKGGKITVAGEGVMLAGAGLEVVSVGTGTPVVAGMEVVGGTTTAVGEGVGFVGAISEGIATALDVTADFVTTGTLPDVKPIAMSLAENLAIKKLTRYAGTISDKFAKYVPDKLKEKLNNFLPGHNKNNKPNSKDTKPDKNKPTVGTTIVGNAKPPKDPCKLIENGIPTKGYRGGKHGAIQKGGSKYTPLRESHHMPSDDAHDKAGTLTSYNAPSIQMDKVDHQKTASWGSSASAKAYRNRQAQLLKNGKAGFLAAMMMDIADVKAKFGNKYDGAIAQMIAWAKCKKYI